ncbi:MAG TPA: helix-turn-helix transcriptional regulator [Erysipelotrichaceae bacterium]|jgi:transcriptional regulator with XRE-family HTH domain|nr:helix-turn-helix transcriptional regulator [Erysipelotrichaceae bacterium]
MLKQQKIDIGKRLKQARKDKGLTMAQLGELVDLHHSTISRYENGMIDRLDVRKLKEFAKVLDVTPEWIVGWQNINDSNDKVYTLHKGDKFYFFYKEFVENYEFTKQDIEDLTDYARYIQSRNKGDK